MISDMAIGGIIMKILITAAGSSNVKLPKAEKRKVETVSNGNQNASAPQSEEETSNDKKSSAEELEAKDFSEGDFAYHCTYSEDAATSICKNGFEGSEADLTSSLFNAQGYGPVCIRCKLKDLKKLKLYPLNAKLSFDVSDYPDDVQGLYETCHQEPSRKIYYIFDIQALNSNCKFERYPEGDR